MKAFALITVLMVGGLLFYGLPDFPDWGDPVSPASTHLSPFYIEQGAADTHAPNVVTAVLAYYRGYDTMFEAAVIFSAGLACFFLLRTFRQKSEETRLYRHIPTGVTLRIEEGGKTPAGSEEFEPIDSHWVPYDMIINMTCRLIVPFVQLFALYVIAHGHYSPGGGFQGGVLFGAAIILFAISHDLRSVFRRLQEKAVMFLSAVGVLIYAGTGVVCLVLGGNFLDYSFLAGMLGVDAVMARSHGILIIEIGVGLAVMAVMVMLYYNLSSAGRHDEGL